MRIKMLHPEEIRAKLRMKFGTLGEFERARKLPARSVTDVLRGRSVKRTEKAIAKELGVGLHVISRRYADLVSVNASPNVSTNADDSSEPAETHRLNAGGR